MYSIYKNKCPPNFFFLFPKYKAILLINVILGNGDMFHHVPQNAQ